MITEETIRASIRILKYLLIIELGADFERFCILSPKTKEHVHIKNETTVRRLSVREVIILKSILVVIICSCANTTELNDSFSAIPRTK